MTVQFPLQKKHAAKAAAVVLLSCLLAAASACGREEAGKADAPPPEVTYITTKAQEAPLPVEFVGQLHGAQDNPIRARVEGFLEGVHFDEGTIVEEGQLLYTIEKQPYEADVAAKLGKVAEAKTVLARSLKDLNRAKALVTKQAISESDLDAATTEYEAAKGNLEAAEANLNSANIILGYTEISSPIRGVIGKTLAKPGDFVGRSPNPIILNTVSNITTMRAEFFLTENQYLELAGRISELEERLDDGHREEREEMFELILSDGSVYPHMGRFDFLDRNVDPTTGSILVQATFPNPKMILRPGQFAKVRTVARVVPDAILVPQRCVAELQGLSRVFVVGDENKIEERQIKPGPVVGSDRLVAEGLKPGEKVVYEGLQKIGDGMVVAAKPAEIEPAGPDAAGKLEN